MTLQSLAATIADRLGRDSPIVRTLRPTYERVLSAIHGGQGIPYAINGETYRIDARYRHQLGSEYDAHIAEFLRPKIRPGASCWNVGANIGVYPLQLSRWSGPTGQVVAFEPNAGARAVMERHLEWNGIAARTTVVPFAVADFEGEAVFHGADADGMSRLGAAAPPLEGRATATQVRVVTLDSYRAQVDIPPDWLLIDVEGAEMAVLRGAQLLIREGGASLGIIVELHPGAWRRDGLSPEMFADVCESVGRRAVPLSAHDPYQRVGHVALVPA